jgi:hypothetical protein
MLLWPEQRKTSPIKMSVRVEVEGPWFAVRVRGVGERERGGRGAENFPSEEQEVVTVVVPRVTVTGFATAGRVLSQNPNTLVV